MTLILRLLQSIRHKFPDVLHSQDVDTHQANHVNSASYQRVFQLKSPRLLCDFSASHYKHEKTSGELVVNFMSIPRVIRELCLVGSPLFGLKSWL